MKQKYIAVLTVALFSAPAGFSQVTLNTSPSRDVGQPQLVPESVNPNLVEGRELFSPQGVALDTSVTPPIIYVADSGNNRVLAWKNATGFTNGQPADLIIGQVDKYSTSVGGPGTTFTSGLNTPTGLAVDGSGNLYVVDSGNNRVVRYPTPFAQTNQFPNLFIGQPNINSRVANYPSGQLSAQGLFLSNGNTTLQATIAFDRSGDLWVTDPGNDRVLEFPAAQLAGTGGGLTASVEIGQLDFVSKQTALNGNTSGAQIVTNQFVLPAGLAFDPVSGQLYVSDGPSSPNIPGRVLVFTPPFSNGMAASRIMGVFPPTLTTAPSTTQIYQTEMGDPEGIFFLADDSVGVVDAAYNRILIFPPFSQWPSQNTQYSPTANWVVGQLSFFGINPNANASGSLLTYPASSATLHNPVAAVFLASASELFVSDSSNNRVLVMPLKQVSTTSDFGAATSVLGQDTFAGSSINLIEGREFAFVSETGSGSVQADAGVAIDSTGSVPHLYVADPYNNRVLGFYDVRKMTAGASADIVIGQPDLTTAQCNYNPQNPPASGDPNSPNQSSLCEPVGVLVDSSGNLYVADRENGRVIRFPAPFAAWPRKTELEQADLVIGQQNFTSVVTDPTASSMAAPYGMAFTGVNGLLVSDQKDNRVLYFPFTQNGTFRAGTDNGLSASKVFGQPDFSTITAASGLNQLNAPHHISTDSNGQLYVADSGNGRVLIFGDPNSGFTASTDAEALYAITGLNSPRGVYVNPTTGVIWVANTNSSTLLQYPKYENLVLSPASTATIPDANGSQGFAPLAVLQDQYGDLYVADSTSRVAAYFPAMQPINGANFRPSFALAPAMVASLCSPGSNCNGGAALFGPTTASFNSLPNPVPLPTTLGDTQVLVNGVAAPLYYVSPTQINFYVPSATPSTGTTEVDAIQVSTGRLLASTFASVSAISPALFNCGGIYSGGQNTEVCAINQDGTVNTPTNPAKRGSVIALYGTGQGLVTGLPSDGSPAPNALTPTPATPRVFISPCYVDECPVEAGDPSGGPYVTYSGLAPGEIGVWQIDVYVPMAVVPSTQVPILVTYQGVSNMDSGAPYRLTIAVN